MIKKHKEIIYITQNQSDIHVSLQENERYSYTIDLILQSQEDRQQKL